MITNLGNIIVQNATPKVIASSHVIIINTPLAPGGCIRQSQKAYGFMAVSTFSVVILNAHLRKSSCFGSFLF